MISLSENQAVKVSIEIASELENAIYLIVKNKHEGVEDKSMYEQLFQQMIEWIEKMGSENIRKQFVQPTMYYPRIDEIDGTF